MSKTPKLRFPEFNSEWKTYSLGNVVEFYDSKRKPVKEQERTSGPYAYYGATGIIDYINDFIFEGEYLLLGEDGANIVTRNAPLVYKTSGKFWVNNHAHIFKPKDNFNIDFLKYYLELINYIPYNTGTAQPKLNAESVKIIPVKAPNIKEQERIASLFLLVDKKIEKQKKKVETLQEYKKGIMQKIFLQKVRFKDEDGESYPKWEVKILGDICSINKGEQLNKLDLLSNGEYYALNGGIEPSGYTENWNTKENTISISEGGASCGYVKFNVKKFWSGGHCYTLEGLSKSIYNEYLYQYLKFYEPSIMALRVGSGLPNIQKSALTGFKVSIPAIEEQQKIADILFQIEEKIYKEQEKLEQLKKFKKGLLQKMFV
ncbi:restriction endonuclease subunit S [Clostridium sp. A1-XYC3]|uniref:Restriction endonuclease subunit S n=1 Tax=Clostridium tanneri TaxID=3037988 RepID=A0ABU4JXV8_9CLOT|nr:restriction endonuclease subunit S [Clostridium sp. A1-XYC3]MDW8802951.1 restriction endonuclease subunit S [Clostridium sp. A1-XYC3]